MTDFGFLVTVADGQPSVELRSGHSAPGSRPLVGTATGGEDVAVLAGRLHYRAGLARAVGGLDEASSTDAALALALYHRDGATGLDRLEGDFALVIWDGRRRCLVARRDPLGGYPLFWTKAGDVTAASTGMLRLANLQPQPLLDPAVLAGFLLSGSVPEEQTEECAYRDVHRVRADTVVTLSLDRGTVDRRRYWDWQERIVDPGTDRAEALGERYRELLAAAVVERIDGLTVAELSGGMDSTAVCLLAREAIRSGLATGPLHAVTLAYEHLPDLARERPYIEAAVAAGQPDVIWHRLVADDLLDFNRFTDPPPHDQPSQGGRDLAAYEAELSLLEEIGAATMLTGMGADDLLDLRPYHLADLVRNRQLRTAWNDACAWAAPRQSRAVRVLARYGFPEAQAQTTPLWRFGRRDRPGLRNVDQWSLPPWISPEFARQHRLEERLTETTRRAHRAAGTPGLSLALHGIEARVGDPYRCAFAAPRGISLAHPFLDPRVLSFALGALTRMRADPHQSKPLLAEATRGLLPEPIRTRADKRPFNEVFYLGLRRNIEVLRGLLDEPALADLGMVDRAMVARWLDDAAMGIADPWQCHTLTLTLVLAVWLSHQEQWRQASASQGTTSVR